MTEAEILQGCRRGDREAQRELYALTCDRVYRVLLRVVRDPHDAFDLAQETYLRVFSKIEQFEGNSGVATWMHRIAVNEALQFLRRQKSQDQHLQVQRESALRDQQNADTPGDPLEIEDALAHLPDAERTLIVLKYFEGMNYAEMGRVLEKPPGTIASGLNRARQMLRAVLAGERDERPLEISDLRSEISNLKSQISEEIDDPRHPSE